MNLGLRLELRGIFYNDINIEHLIKPWQLKYRLRKILQLCEQQLILWQQLEVCQCLVLLEIQLCLILLALLNVKR